MTHKIEAAATRLMSQLLYADEQGFLVYLDDIVECYWDDDFDRCKIEVVVTSEAEDALLPQWSAGESIPLNEQHFAEALSKILHPSGEKRNADRKHFWTVLVDDEDEYSWMALDAADASTVLEVVLFGCVLYLLPQTTKGTHYEACTHCRQPGQRDRRDPCRTHVPDRAPGPTRWVQAAHPLDPRRVGSPHAGAHSRVGEAGQGYCVDR